METPRHRAAPSAPPSSTMAESLQRMRSITHSFENASSLSGRPTPGSQTPRAPNSARRFVYQRSSPKQSFVVQKTPNDRPGREMGVSTVKLPYSQPWYRPQLEETLEELERSRREVLKLKEVVASIAKERDAAQDVGRRSSEIIIQKTEEIKVLQQRIVDSAEQNTRERFATEAMHKEREQMVADNAKLKGRIHTLNSELENLKTAMSSYLEDRIKAEMSSAESAVSAAQAIAEARKAKMANEEVLRERDAARLKADAAEAAEKRRQAELARLAAEAEAERRARAEARIIQVAPDTREFLQQKMARVGGSGDADLEATSAKYTEPGSVWEMLEPRSFDGQHDSEVVLLSAAWLRTCSLRKLPERQKLPPEAIIPVRSLRAIASTIDKGMAKGMARPLPIICILHPKMRLHADGGSHPDPEGRYLDMIVKALDSRWAEYTRRRGGTQSTGVTDMGVFFEWSSLYMAPHEEGGRTRRTEHEQAVFESSLAGLHALFSHKLSTVWMVQESPHPIGPLGLMYSTAWPTYLAMVATLIKPSNLADTNAWPQLLRLGEDAYGIELDRSEQEKVPRSSPAEPLAFRNGHKLAQLEGVTELLERQLPEAIAGLLAGVEELDFRRCGWGDEDASRLSVVLPLCGRLKRLQLSGNRIQNLGASALAGALSNSNLQTLELLCLDNNEIGDAGASALFQRMSPNEESEVILSELKEFRLSNNELNDPSVLALSGAVMGGALRGCKKVLLDGNPASKATVKGVKKALKKNKAPSK